MPDLVPRSKSTFCPKVCICCYWERKYKLLLACHKTLRLQLVSAVGHKKADVRVQTDDDSSDEGGAIDLVEMMEGHRR